MTGAQRITESLRLFDAAAERMLAGIKSQFPDISDEEVRAEFAASESTKSAELSRCDEFR